MANKPAGKPLVVFRGTGADEDGRVPRVLMATFFSFFLNGVIIGALIIGGKYLNVFTPAAVANESTKLDAE